MFKRTSALVAAAALMFGGVAAIAEATANAAAPIDPAGTYTNHYLGTGDTFTMTLVDTDSSTGHWSLNDGEAGTWLRQGKVISLAWTAPGSRLGFICIATIAKKGLSSLKKPGLCNSPSGGEQGFYALKTATP
ncbi:MAG: hypothetical protein JWL83_1783 [Actinomycetia bacterium]|nr:hypothetical protein [Actinomycetes bacterium]